MLLGRSLDAQLASGYSNRAYASRAELEENLREADQLAESGPEHRRHYHRAESALLRNRLEQGDFQEGDRVMVKMPGIKITSDTFMVRSGKVIHLPDMEDFSVAGLLRSEFQSKLSAHIGRYLRDPSIEAQPLVRLSVLGAVSRIGFYYAPADAVLSDVLMLAGGPTPAADLKEVTIRRLGRTVWSPGDIRFALAEGLTIDQLHLRAGDEIEVGTKSTVDWRTVLQVTSAIIGLAGLAFTLSNR